MAFVLPFIHFFSFTTYLFLAIYVILSNPKSSLNRACTALFLSFAIWSFSMIFIHNPYATKSIANLFYNIGSFGWTSFASFSLLFVLVLAEKKKILRSKLFYPALFILPAILIYEQWRGAIAADYIKQAWGWAYVWTDSIWSFLFYIYYIVFMAMGFYLLFNLILKTKDPIKKKQTTIILSTASVTLVMASLTDIILPRLHIHTIPNVAPFFAIAWATGITFSIAKYRMMMITPSLAVDTIVSEMADALVLLNEKGRVSFINKATSDLLGYKSAELIGKSIEILFPDGTKSVMSDNIRKRHIPNIRDFFLRAKNGEYIPVFFTSSILKGTAGELLGTVCIARDITERKNAERILKKVLDELEIHVSQRTRELQQTNIKLQQDIAERRKAEKALAEIESNYRTLVENLPQKIFLKDKNSVYISCNENYAKDLRIKPNEIKGKRDYDFFPQEFANKYRGDDRRIVKTGEIEDIEEKYIVNNVDVFVHTVKTPVRDEKGNIIGVLGIFWDITERKKAEEELRRSEEHFREFFNEEPEYCYMISPDGIILDVNKSALNALKYEKNELVGKPLKIIYSSESLPKVKEVFAKWKKNEELKNEEVEIISKKGERMYVLLSATSLKDTKGRIAYSIWVQRNITERRKAQEERENMQRQLVRAQKMEAIGSFAGGISHDFNNLLTAISGYAELIQNQVEIDNPINKDLNQITMIVERAATLVRQLLAFSRRQILKPEVINLNTIVTNLEKMLRRLIGENIRLVTIQDEKLKNIRADVGQIEQVIVNLVVNARDAMRQGGKLIIKGHNVTIDEPIARIYTDAYPGSFACLSVQDTGIGMDQDTIQHIFDPFYTTKELHQGTGLGLSVVFGIVKQHKGWINVYSEPNKGSIFKIYFPTVSAEEEKSSQTIVEAKTIKGKGERVLLVEDENHILEFAKRALNDHGYEIFAAQNAQDAEEIFKKENGNFNVVFSDIVLTDKGAIQMVDKFQSKNPRLKILLTSGYVRDDLQWSIIQEKGYYFMEKPYRIKDLLRNLRTIIESN